jgi:hypothetical protein
MKFQCKSLLAILIPFFILSSCNQKQETIYNEADVPEYTLPDILLDDKGMDISSDLQWKETRREEILELFKEEVYGQFPEAEYTLSFKVNKLINNFLDSTAILKEVECEISTQNGKSTFTILSVFPISENPVPVFTGLNFYGNHTIDSSTEISLHTTWTQNNEDLGITGNTVDEKSRGVRNSRWPLSTLINRGYGLSTVYYGDFDPDYDDGFNNGLHPLFAEVENINTSDAPSSISIWAKGMSLMVDYLMTESAVDPTKIIAFGHSRLGKTSLWAGANEERFAAVISNNSGCGGAALSMRNFGETVLRINTVFPHWFCDNFNVYNKKLNKLPVDQHMLLALMAPRPVYVASATDDQWADPNGEFLSLKEATAVYELFGFEQDFPEIQPLPDQSYQGITGYHLRTGKHDVTEYDWIMYMDWCDRWVD